jgi:glycerophosphoryl diester phosphodiesterase
MTCHPAVIGHRGWPRRFPDNTLAGFLAVLPHVDGVELDVRRSGDGKLIVSHDPAINGLEVASTPWSRLAEEDLGGGHHPALLDEVLTSLPGVPVQIEVKNLPWEQGYEADHRLALEAADRSRPVDTITSFDPEAVSAVHRVYPDVRTGLIVGPGDDLDSEIRQCLDAGHVLLVPHVTLLADREMPALDGIEVTPWVVNDIETATELATLGVSGIITDDPPALGGIREPT